MGMGKIKALKIRSIGFLAPDFLHVAFLGFSAKKRLRQKLKVMSEILSVPASRNNFAKKDRIYEGENETYIEASVENSSSILYDKEIRNKPRTRRTKRNV